MSYKGEKYVRQEQSKERLTALFCWNATGKEKLKPLVARYWLKPRCLKGLASQPVKYTAINMAHTTEELFAHPLLELDKVMAKQERKNLCLLDNCSAHKRGCRLEIIKFEFCFANWTSVLQSRTRELFVIRKSNFVNIVQRIFIGLKLTVPTRHLNHTNDNWGFNKVKATVPANCWGNMGTVDFWNSAAWKTVCFCLYLVNARRNSKRARPSIIPNVCNIWWIYRIWRWN